jgi:hypothetical protein
MLHTKEKKPLKGMTLTEVIIAMVIIILVTIAAYMGVSASTNYMMHGVDLRNSDGKAASELEKNAVAYEESGAEVTTYIPYVLQVREIITDSNGNKLPSADEEKTEGSVHAGVIEGTDEQVEYRLFVPYKEPEEAENP